MNVLLNDRLRFSARAAAIHFMGCMVLALMAGALVFGLWYPSPYNAIEGGRELFFLVIAVDVVCGPLLTLVIFDPRKGRTELLRDLSVIVSIQVLALIYGLYSVAIARPVFLAFEVDRFRVVSRAEIAMNELPQALPEFRNLSFTGPELISVRVPAPNEPDYLRSLQLSIGGLDTALRPSLWRPYGEQREKIRSQLRSPLQLMQRNAEARSVIESKLKELKRLPDSVGYVPVIGRTGSGWIALLDRGDLRVIGFAGVDGF